MQILEVSGRVCVKSTEVSPQLVKAMLTSVPPGMYIAMYKGSNYPYNSINGVPEGLELIIESERVWLLKAHSKEPVLPVLPKQVAMLPKVDGVKLPVLGPQPAQEYETSPSRTDAPWRSAKRSTSGSAGEPPRALSPTNGRVDRPRTMAASASAYLSKPAGKARPELPRIVPHNAYNSSSTSRTVLHKSIQYLQESYDVSHQYSNVLPFRKAW